MRAVYDAEDRIRERQGRGKVLRTPGDWTVATPRWWARLFCCFGDEEWVDDSLQESNFIDHAIRDAGVDVQGDEYLDDEEHTATLRDLDTVVLAGRYDCTGVRITAAGRALEKQEPSEGTVAKLPEGSESKADPTESIKVDKCCDKATEVTTPPAGGDAGGELPPAGATGGLKPRNELKITKSRTKRGLVNLSLKRVIDRVIVEFPLRQGRIDEVESAARALSIRRALTRYLVAAGWRYVDIARVIDEAALLVDTPSRARMRAHALSQTAEAKARKATAAGAGVPRC